MTALTGRLVFFNLNTSDTCSVYGILYHVTTSFVQLQLLK